MRRHAPHPRTEEQPPKENINKKNEEVARRNKIHGEEAQTLGKLRRMVMIMKIITRRTHPQDPKLQEHLRARPRRSHLQGGFGGRQGPTFCFVLAPSAWPVIMIRYKNKNDNYYACLNHNVKNNCHCFLLESNGWDLQPNLGSHVSLTATALTCSRHPTEAKDRCQRNG